MTDQLSEMLGSPLRGMHLELVDLELRSGILKVVVDREGGVDLDALTEATRLLSAVLDADEAFSTRPYTLEVTSPGLERPLRRPEHFLRAVGELLSVRMISQEGGVTRIRGDLISADESGFELRARARGSEGEILRIGYEQVERAHTVFEWGAAAGESAGASSSGDARGHDPTSGSGRRRSRGENPAKGARRSRGENPAKGANRVARKETVSTP